MAFHPQRICMIRALGQIVYRWVTNYSQEPELMSPQLRRSNGSAMSGSLRGHDLATKQSGTANQYKVVPTHLYPIKITFYSDGSSIYHDANVHTHSV